MEKIKQLIDSANRRNLILDEELNRCNKWAKLCNECRQPRNSFNWCQICHFQRDFKNWSSGNDDVDKFIQQAQLRATKWSGLLEWIEHDRFENIEYLAKGGFGTVFKAIWKDGPIDRWDSENNQWKRYTNYRDRAVALKCLHNSQNITAEFLREVRYFFKVSTVLN